MNSPRSKYFLPLVFSLPFAFAFACGTADEDELDGEDLVSESTALAMITEDSNAEPSTEDAMGGMDETDTDADDATEDGIDSSMDATPDESSVSCNFSARRQHILEQFDADGDGRLNRDERAELRDAVDNHPRARGIVNRLMGRRPHFHTWRRIIWAFDVDGDHTLSTEERAELVAAMEARCERRRAAFIERNDTNGDGQISREELVAAIERARENFQTAKQAFLQRYDANNNGTIDLEERVQVKADIVARRQAIKERVKAQYDVDGNGRLDQAEKDALKAAIRERVSEGPSR